MPSNLDAPERRVNKRPSDQDLRADRVAPRAVALKDSGDMKAALLDRKTKRNTSKYVEKGVRQRKRVYCCCCGEDTGVEGLYCKKCSHSREICLECIMGTGSSGC